MRTPFSLILIVLVISIIDIYSFRSIYILLKKKSRIVKLFSSISFFSISLIVIAGFIFFMNNLPGMESISVYPTVFMFFAIVFMIYFPKIIITFFLLLRDLKVLFSKLLVRVSVIKKYNNDRREFLLKTGVILAAFPFVSILNGVLRGRFNYQILREKLIFKNLPNEFNGLKIVQLSDFHISCFIGNEHEVEAIVEIVNSLNPDIIVFTGDMINNFSDELMPFIARLKELRASIGKYAITGNHDYGDYSKWNSEQEKKNNFAQLLKYYDEIGFSCLLNRSISLKSGNNSIELIGVENWGHPPFPRYGDLNLAMQNTAANNFKILLSHDPSHWRAKVIQKTNIDLTLSGHTHGMQFGIEIPGFKWSPAKFIFPEWAGIYKDGDQVLYVNRGIGYIGVAARVGILPEVTMLELFTE